MHATALAALTLSACGPGDDTDPAVHDTDGSPDYADEGPLPVVTSSGTDRTSCDMAWDLYVPDGAAPDTLVVLSHGFARDRARMTGHAAHLASWGLAVLTPDLCHASPLDTDHAQNGRDLADLAATSGYARIVYAGHSAGGLASLLAANDDPHAVAAFALDGVDADGLGAAAAATLPVPLAGLVAEPSACNSDNNGAGWYAAAADGQGLRVVESDHCDYESPTDGVCRAFCATDNPTFGDDALAGTVRALSTAWILWRSGADARGARYWTAGDAAQDALLASGAISSL